ncbi:MAG: YkoF family thiamine/hydroxymethylpyrimidine-binding protein [Chloroflexota bacterium]|nr:YkoF family thiamine/hydroxymethylpyrimidine-binding protein [Chloroflexota bacterium]
MAEISAQVSLYPLRQLELGPAIRAAWRIFDEHGLEVERGAMSTVVWGEEEAVMGALREAFDWAGREGEVVMVITLSNACPHPRGQG